MYIHEAIQATTKREPYIARKCWGYTHPAPAGQWPNGRTIKLSPTDSPDFCVVISEMCGASRGWFPTAEDLIADDWITTR